jgi:hypothetical protein
MCVMGYFCETVKGWNTCAKGVKVLHMCSCNFQELVNSWKIASHHQQLYKKGHLCDSVQNECTCWPLCEPFTAKLESQNRDSINGF